MSSLYDELSEKLKKDPRLTKRGGARFDLSLLLFNAREALCELWEAADRCVQSRNSEAHSDLYKAVDKLRPVFGERRELSQGISDGGRVEQVDDSKSSRRKPRAAAKKRG